MTLEKVHQSEAVRPTVTLILVLMILLQAALVLFLMQPAFAQTSSDWLTVIQPATGMRVEVEMKSGERFVGKILDVSAEDLTLKWHSSTRNVPRAGVRMVQLVRGKTRAERAKIGMAIGAGLGVAIGLSEAADSHKASLQAAAAFGYAAYLGGIVAAVAAWHPTQHKIIYLAY